MKKTMKKRIAAMLLALACLPVTGMSVQAAGLPSWWGNTTWDAFADYELIGQGTWNGKPAQIYLTSPGSNSIVLVQPNTNLMQFDLRDEVDLDDAGMQIAQVLEAYFPGIQDRYDASFRCTVGEYGQPGFGIDTDNRAVKLSLSDIPENIDEIEAGLLVALARRHLISGFYGLGETAFYDMGDMYTNMPYPDTVWTADGTEKPIDWDAVQQWLTEQHPGLTVEKTPYTKYIQSPEKGGGVTTEECYRYSISGAENLTEEEQIRLICELWEHFDIQPQGILLLEDANPPVTGRNALESPGDVTLDCELSLLDAIALNKNLLGMESLCDTALKNADADGNGTADASDSLAILRELVGLTEGFQEK